MSVGGTTPQSTDAFGERSASLWYLILFVLFLWGQFFVVLAPSWTGATYYDYGWLVPPFALLFAWRRWQEIDFSRSKPLPQHWLWLGVFLSVLLLVPLRVVEHVDVFWRLALWMHAAIVFAVTHLVLALFFGLRPSLALLPATIFALLAVPIPTFLEQDLVQGLTRQVVRLASGALPLAGFPVDVAGNSLVVKGELLDVAEGCSGIRSFQSSAMAAICLGELLRLTAGRRVLLVAIGIVLATVCNAGRVFVLARIAHDEGRAASDAAHDSVGFWVLLLTYGGISLGAWLLSQWGQGKRSVIRKVGESDD